MAGLRSFIAWWMGGAGNLGPPTAPTRHICTHTDKESIIVYTNKESIVQTTNKTAISVTSTRAC